MTFDELFRYIAIEYLRDRPIIDQAYSESSKNAHKGATITQLMNEAETIFCRDVHCILDTETAACCQIALTAGQRYYNLHRSVFRVDSVLLLDTVNTKEYYLTQKSFPVTLVDSNVTSDERVDIPQYWSAAVSHNVQRRIQFWPILNATYTLQAQLAVYRSPLTQYSFPLGTDSVAVKEEKLARTSELPEEYQTSIGDYVLARMLSSRDVDRHALRESAEAMRRWRQTIIDARSARHLTVNTANVVAANPWH